MGAAKKLIDKKVLRDFVPINALSSQHIDEVSRKAVIEHVRPGKYVFRKGDRDYQSIYLLEGKIELIGDGRKHVTTIVAGSAPALHPLAHKQPRPLSAKAIGNVAVACVDSGMLDVLLTWDESSGYDVIDITAEEDGDWMTRMLQSQAFLQLPPANIHQLLMRLESMHASAGETVVKQGDEADYFYVVKNGRLAVSRKASARSKEVLLTELGNGACFGEDALVSGAMRNATVTMLTDGTLMRLAKDDFNELLLPLVHEVDFDQAQELTAEGAQWLDVRLPGEFENQSIVDSWNVPLSALRNPVDQMGSATMYILYCDTGRRSSAGAFILSQRGFTVYVLKNGLIDVPEDALTSGGDASAANVSKHEAEIISMNAGANTAMETADLGSERLVELEAACAQLEAENRQLQEHVRDLESDHQVQALSESNIMSQKKITELEASLESAQASVDELQSKLDSIEADHNSSISSVHDALARADTEKENIFRENSRLTELLKKTEDELKDEQQTREDGIHRVRRELETSIESIQLQLQQAQERARQAEQQLLDSGKGTNQEMEVRLQADQQIEKTLREELSSTITERDLVQERLTVIEQEASDLQAACDQAESKQQALETQLVEAADTGELDALKQQLVQVEEKRDSAQASESQLQLEMDQLRAEFEVTRSLVDMQASDADVDVELRFELEQVKKNVGVAVRLRTQAESQVTELQQQVDALTSDLDLMRLRAQESQKAASAVSEASANNVEKVVEDVVVDASPAPSSSQSWKSLLIGLLAGSVLAAGIVWWLLGKPAPVSRSAPQPIKEQVSKMPPTQVTPPDSLAAPEPASGQPQPVRTFSDRLANGEQGPGMVELHADQFAMGSGPTSANFDERPRHDVQLGAFAIGKHEVTFDDYARFVRATGATMPANAGWGRSNRPVINVRWNDAVNYAKWLSEQTGQRYRLPTEAEWEFAARGGSLKRYAWGQKFESGRANCFDCSAKMGGSRTLPAGSFAANNYAIHDMAGNVMEWVQDCYQPNYKNAPADGSAIGISACSARVVRGGGYSSPGMELRSASRDKREPGSRLDNLGFRLVRER